MGLGGETITFPLCHVTEKSKKPQLSERMEDRSHGKLPGKKKQKKPPKAHKQGSWGPGEKPCPPGSSLEVTGRELAA